MLEICIYLTEVCQSEREMCPGAWRRVATKGRVRMGGKDQIRRSILRLIDRDARNSTLR